MLNSSDDNIDNKHTVIMKQGKTTLAYSNAASVIE
jgi:hypothetical protein